MAPNTSTQYWRRGDFLRKTPGRPGIGAAIPPQYRSTAIPVDCRLQKVGRPQIGSFSERKLKSSLKTSESEPLSGHPEASEVFKRQISCNKDLPVLIFYVFERPKVNAGASRRWKDEILCLKSHFSGATKRCKSSKIKINMLCELEMHGFDAPSNLQFPILVYELLGLPFGVNLIIQYILDIDIIFPCWEK